MSGFSPDFMVKGDRSSDDPYQTFLANVAFATGKAKGKIANLFKSNTKEQNNLIGVVYAATHGIIEAEDDNKNALYDSLAQFLATPPGQAVMQNIQRIFDLRQEAMGRDISRRGHFGGPAAAQMDVDEEIAAQMPVNIPTAVVFLYEIATGEGSTMDPYANKEDAVEELTTGGVKPFKKIANVRPAGYVNPSARAPAALAPGQYRTREDENIAGEIERLHSEMQNNDEDTMDLEKGGKRKSRKYRKTNKKSKKSKKRGRKSRKGGRKRYSRHH